ncbi:MAG: D-glycero-beta-D-manno-heptose 1-phosphate adenylyltransferase [Bacteroidetes bacterium]|nr:D-glycero-beta-D-manno-heptose 1-phosphate adenylyltransferase [Bacteroidales bacterium]MBU1010603.1 D-glycero-beta-D-manno-heptose 1-phosphate adenylyltransferase [Bacteroidota bacterium]
MTKNEVASRKIVSLDQLKLLLAQWRFLNKKIVFTNGCFDILHLGHVDYLSKAADLGNILIIGLNTDASVSRIKGPSRPVNDEHARAMLLASLHCVSLVVYFDEPTPYELIRFVQPDVLVKGKDYVATEVVGYDIVTAKGGTVETIDLVEGYSTTSLIEKINRTS